MRRLCGRWRPRPALPASLAHPLSTFRDAPFRCPAAPRHRPGHVLSKITGITVMPRAVTAASITVPLTTSGSAAFHGPLGRFLIAAISWLNSRRLSGSFRTMWSARYPLSSMLGMPSAVVPSSRASGLVLSVFAARMSSSCWRFVARPFWTADAASSSGVLTAFSPRDSVEPSASASRCALSSLGTFPRNTAWIHGVGMPSRRPFCGWFEPGCLAVSVSSSCRRRSLAGAPGGFPLRSFCRPDGPPAPIRSSSPIGRVSPPAAGGRGRLVGACVFLRSLLNVSSVRTLSSSFRSVPRALALQLPIPSTVLALVGRLPGPE